MSSKEPKKVGKGLRHSFALSLLSVIGSVNSFFVIIAMVLAFAFGIYSIWDKTDVVKQALPEQYEAYKPEAEGPGFDELKEVNPELIGWITVYGTNIDYPLLQAEDDDKYVTTGADGKYCLSGAIFLSAGNDPHFRDFNSIIYGHSMAQNAMFGDIRDFGDSLFFKEHAYGNLYYDGKDHGLLILGFAEADAYNSGLYEKPLSDSGKKKAFLEEIRRSAKNIIDGEYKESFTEALPIGLIGSRRIFENDNLALLSTCNTDVTNGRHILVCQITDETFADPFYEAEKKKNVDTVGSGSVSYTVLYVLLIILVALIAAVSVTGRANKKRIKKRKKEG